MAYASKRRLNCKTCYRMHQNALFRMEKVKYFLQPPLQTPPPLGRALPLSTPSASRFSCLRHEAPLTMLSAPLRDLGWRRPWLCPLKCKLWHAVVHLLCKVMVLNTYTTARVMATWLDLWYGVKVEGRMQQHCTQDGAENERLTQRTDTWTSTQRRTDSTPAWKSRQDHRGPCCICV